MFEPKLYFKIRHSVAFEIHFERVVLLIKWAMFNPSLGGCMSTFAHVSAVSINQTVGDWAGNKARIVSAIEEAKNRGARLIVFPEMCISGYSLGDRLLMEGAPLWHACGEARPPLPEFP